MSQKKNHKRNIDHDRRSSSQASRLGWKSFLKKRPSWLVGIVTTAIVTALMTALFTPVGNGVVNFGGNLFYSTQSSVSLQMIQVIPSQIDDNHAFANALVLSNAELSYLNSNDPADPGHKKWFTERHAVDIGKTTAEVVIQGNQNHAVRIMNIQPIVSCQQPLNGTLFYSPPAGIDANVKLLFDLDNPQMPPSYQSGYQSGGKDFFGTHTVSLNPGEQMTFRLVASTKKHFCKFTYSMSVLNGDKVDEVDITNHGQPFQVTSILMRDDTEGLPVEHGEFSDYHILYVGGVANERNHFLWSQVDPKTYSEITP